MWGREGLDGRPLVERDRVPLQVSTGSSTRAESPPDFLALPAQPLSPL